jgi:hypothetical protein
VARARLLLPESGCGHEDQTAARFRSDLLTQQLRCYVEQQAAFLKRGRHGFKSEGQCGLTLVTSVSSKSHWHVVVEVHTGRGHIPV